MQFSVRLSLCTVPEPGTVYCCTQLINGIARIYAALCIDIIIWIFCYDSCRKYWCCKTLLFGVYDSVQCYLFELLMAFLILPDSAKRSSLAFVILLKSSDQNYSELDSSGSVKKLTKGVSLKRKSGETELYILFNKLFLFTLIQLMKYFNL